MCGSATGTEQVLHVLGKKTVYVSMSAEHTSSNTFIYPVVTCEDNNIKVEQVGRNNGSCFLKDRLALCMASDSGIHDMISTM